MRPHGKKQQLEQRRYRAIAMLRAGRPYRFVAETLRASLSSVVRWAQSHRKKGREGLKSKPTPGRPPQLSPTQKRKLLQLLKKGAPNAGYSTDLWTLQRIVKLIKKHFGVRYHRGHVWWLMMKQLRWSCQKPEKRALERNEEAIAHWIRYKLPHIKKSQKTWGPSRLPR